MHVFQDKAQYYERLWFWLSSAPALAPGAAVSITLNGISVEIKRVYYNKRHRSARVYFKVPYIESVTSTQAIPCVLTHGNRKANFEFMYKVRLANAPRVVSIWPNIDTSCGGRTVRLDIVNPPWSMRNNPLPNLYFGKTMTTATKMRAWGRKLMVSLFWLYLHPCYIVL